MKARIKSKEEIEAEELKLLGCEKESPAYKEYRKMSDACNGGYQLPGQYFPVSLLRYCGREIEIEQSWTKCYVTKIDGEYCFFSHNAVIIP